MSPADYKVSAEDQAYFDLWKKLFMTKNKLSAEYFNEHIRISRAGRINASTKGYEGYFEKRPNLDEIYRVEAFYLVDWANVPVDGLFAIKHMDSDQYLTPEEIESLAGDVTLFRPVYESSLDMSIDFIRIVEGDNLKNTRLTETVLPCEDLLEKLRAVHPSMRPLRKVIAREVNPSRQPVGELKFSPMDGGFYLAAQGKSGPNTCPFATISLETGSVDVEQEEPCVIWN